MNDRPKECLIYSTIQIREKARKLTATGKHCTHSIGPTRILPALAWPQADQFQHGTSHVRGAQRAARQLRGREKRRKRALSLGRLSNQKQRQIVDSDRSTKGSVSILSGNPIVGLAYPSLVRRQGNSMAVAERGKKSLEAQSGFIRSEIGARCDGRFGVLSNDPRVAAKRGKARAAAAVLRSERPFFRGSDFQFPVVGPRAAVESAGEPRDVTCGCAGKPIPERIVFSSAIFPKGAPPAQEYNQSRSKVVTAVTMIYYKSVHFRCGLHRSLTLRFSA